MERKLSETLEQLVSSPVLLATAQFSSLEGDPLYPLALVQLADSAKSPSARMISAVSI